MSFDPEFAAGKGGGYVVSYGGFFARFVAWLIDGVVVNLLAGIIGPLLVSLVKTDATASLLTSSFLIGAIYNAAMISSESQATLGKMAMGLKVATLAGERVPPLAAFIREFSKYLSGLLLGLGYIMAAFTQRSQALHDMIASTVVVKSR